MNPQASEYSVQSNYLETLLDLPWNEGVRTTLTLNHAQAVLDQDHYGLEKVKERIIEHLAVLKIKGDLKAPILCLYGPPGVGKNVVGSKHCRGARPEIRAHEPWRAARRSRNPWTPQNLHRRDAGPCAPKLEESGHQQSLFVLDEIDKLGRDHQGDPSSALLEVLDPEQNHTFHDNYLDLDYDLSKCMFLATCNDLSTIQPALRDRMEIIDVSGYTLEEKVQIGKRHLLPKHLNKSGLATAS